MRLIIVEINKNELKYDGINFIFSYRFGSFISVFIVEAVLLSISIAQVSVEKEGHKSGIFMVELKNNINRPLAAILTINTIANTIGAVGVEQNTTYLRK